MIYKFYLYIMALSTEKEKPAIVSRALSDPQWFIALTMSSVIFLASPRSIIVPSL